MVTHIDMVGSQITWTKKGKAWLEKKKEPPGKLAYDENVELFNLLWHQVIGVIWTPEVVFTNNFIKVKKNTANLNHQAKMPSGENVILTEQSGFQQNSTIHCILVYGELVL